MKSILCIVAALSLAGCSRRSGGGEDAADKLFRLVPASETNVTFNNVLAENDSTNVLTYQYLYNGSGVAAADFDKNGLVDLFFAANFSPCKLYFNRGNFKFEDVTAKAGIATTGWCGGVSVVDINNDGYDDVYVCRSGPTEDRTKRTNLLYVNQKDGTFKEQASDYGIADDGHSTQAFFFDYDMDNDLDLFVLNHSVSWFFEMKKQDIENHRFTDFTTPHFYRNDNGHYTDVSAKAGIQSNAFCLAASIRDFNNDGYPDMYVCNDYIMNDFLYINQKDGTFKEQVYDYFPHTSYYSMGVDAGDFNNDGLIDLMSLDMLPESNDRFKKNQLFFEYDQYMVGVNYGFGHQYVQNALQLNNGDGTYSDIGDLSGMARTDWSWSVLFSDLDNDGMKDVVINNGYRRDFTNKDFLTYFGSPKNFNFKDRKRIREAIEKMPTRRIPNYSFRNNGDLTFTNSGAAWGLNDSAFSNGMVIVDLDNDGDQDVVMSNIDDPAFVYENRTVQNNTQNHFLNVKLETELPHLGYGSLVKIVTPDGIQVLDYQPTRGYLSSGKGPLHFGLGRNARVDSVIVYWCDGYYQAVGGVRSDTVLTVKQERTARKLYNPLPPASPLFKERSDLMQPAYVQRENDDFVDYKGEPLLTQMYSREGPRMATGDVNGDKLDDVFIGGAKDHAGVLYVQTSDGKFVQRPEPAIAETFGLEDMESAFFDADNDGDMDLYVVAGSNEIDPPSPFYNDRLFINDGRGNFTRCPYGNLPFTQFSGSCVATADFDGDGDIDVFRGGRMYAGKYPQPVTSSIFLNDGHGKFVDGTPTVSPQLLQLGMVTDAAWTDFDKDGKTDLVVVGDWIPISFFRNQNNSLVDVTASVMSDTRTSGCWLSVLPADVDGDGDIDFVCGNHGRNTRFASSPDKPAVLYYGDFDKNGSTDAILTCMGPDGVAYPYFPRDNYIDQMRFLRKRYNTHEQFANATYETMFTEEERRDAHQLVCQRNDNVWLRNDNGKFEIVPLPNLAQAFPVYAAVSFDADADGRNDLLVTGNLFNVEVNSGRLDAGKGSVLRYNPSTRLLEAIPSVRSGFNTSLDAKSMVVVRTARGPVVMVGNNSGRLQTFAHVAKRDLVATTR